MHIVENRHFELGKYGTAGTLYKQRFQNLVGASFRSFTREGKKEFQHNCDAYSVDYLAKKEMVVFSEMSSKQYIRSWSK
jgi:hypothetical protein